MGTGKRNGLSRAAVRAQARAVLHGARDARALARFWRSARATAREHPGVAATFPTNGERLLVVSLSDDVQQARLEALVVKALESRGARVDVLTWRSSLRARLLFRALRVRNVVFYDDFGARDGSADDAARAVEGANSVQDLLQYEHRGARVGRQALSTVVRARYEPRIDLEDGDTRAALRQTLAYAIASVDQAERVLDATHPAQLLLVERGYAGFGSIFDVALQRGIPVVQFQAAHRDDAFQLKRYDLATRERHPRSLDEKTWELLRADGLTPERERRLEEELGARAEGKWFMARRIRHATGRRGPDALRDALGLDPTRKVAALFSHILWDASMFYYRDLYPDQGRWFSETVRLAAEDDSVQWLVKLHPALFWKLRADRVEEEPAELRMIREAVGELPSHMRLIRPDDDVDNVDLFRIVDAGVTIRGTVGLELPQLGVPVLTAGTSDYAGRGFTIDADSIEQYESNVRSIATLGRLTDEQVRTAKLYAFGIFCVRPWRFDSFALDYLPVDKAGDTLQHRLRYRVRTPDELRGADDLASFARWVLESRDADYVDEAVLARPPT
jgi:hypothetical protein